MCEISVGAHSCAMHSRLKAAPTANIPEREIPGFSYARISFMCDLGGLKAGRPINVQACRPYHYNMLGVSTSGKS
jgi:hypothetical protein